jgi:RNA polymerase primary sigma factor
MGLKPAQVHRMLGLDSPLDSLEQPTGDRTDGRLGDYVEDKAVSDPSEVIDQAVLQEHLEGLLSTLTPREAKVLRLRFGLQDGRSRTLAQIGQELGLTRERIRQIESAALEKLRRLPHSGQLRDYLN